jgi:hypothetical protein
MSADDPYPALKKGSNTPYYCCECCCHYVRKLSPRAWCLKCERECAEISEKLTPLLATEP